ncbi:MAG: sigma-70 family RNA polymerase sigma factor [Chitinophagaceae bacterium]|nr:sigma-70 family RNA polymerase sigma factor [Chitinophagaceae bacterium]
MTADQLTHHIELCGLNNRRSQKVIYCSFYGYAMSFATDMQIIRMMPLEILNDGFLKVFKEIYHFQPAYSDVISSFKGWLKKIAVYTAIDHFRKKNQKHKVVTSLENVVLHIPTHTDAAISKLSYDDIIRGIQELSPGYRTVFNLFVIDGLSHDEIAAQLGITSGTSKSNLSKARQQLQKILFKRNEIQTTKNAV